ncbi:MAG: DUF4831 family protein [Rikenellaceae bacterium]
MNKFIATFLLSILSISAVAQGYNIARIGLIKEDGDFVLSYPTTTIVVELLVEKEAVTPGVYARYAQKYLGLRAPLVAQTSYTISDASIALAQDTYAASLSAVQPSVEYSKLPADQYSSVILPADDAARDAASAIFTIRRQRRDIVNGEAGEGYFGAGLSEAIASLDKMEQEYLELFLGSRTITQSVERYVFTPQADAMRHVISRFDSKSGILPANDLSGQPIYLQFNVQEFPDTTAIEVNPTAKSKGSSPVTFRIAAPTQCVLYNDSQAIASTVLLIFELGKDVNIETAN